jgi:uncharacterized protein YkwD
MGALERDISMHELFDGVRRLPTRSRLTRSWKSAVPALATATLSGMMLAGAASNVFALSASDAQALLNAHNAYRAKHCVPALTWSAQLAAEAQQWADACPSNGFKHSPGAWQSENGYGENLAWGTNESAQGAVDAWYSEISKYNFNAPSYSNAVGHFTQVIWRNSTQLGCGMASCQGMNYWVCRYSPTGNWNTDKPGVLATNVPALCASGGGGNTTPPPPPPPPPAASNEWSAFAASGKGYWGYAVFKATEQEASNLAFNGCGGNNNGCKTFWTTKDKCVSFADSTQGGYWYAAGGGNDQDQAKQNAVKFCQSGSAPANSCKPKGAWCR